MFTGKYSCDGTTRKPGNQDGLVVILIRTGLPIHPEVPALVTRVMCEIQLGKVQATCLSPTGRLNRDAYTRHQQNKHTGHRYPHYPARRCSSRPAAGLRSPGSYCRRMPSPRAPRAISAPQLPPRLPPCKRRHCPQAIRMAPPSPHVPSGLWTPGPSVPLRTLSSPPFPEHCYPGTATTCCPQSAGSRTRPPRAHTQIQTVLH